MSTKPFFGFGWIETWYNNWVFGNAVTTKPFFGFGWIETFFAVD